MDKDILRDYHANNCKTVVHEHNCELKPISYDETGSPLPPDTSDYGDYHIECSHKGSMYRYDGSMMDWFTPTNRKVYGEKLDELMDSFINNKDIPEGWILQQEAKEL